MCFRPAAVSTGPAKCSECGAEVPADATACPACGAAKVASPYYVPGAAAPGAPKAPGAPGMPKAPGMPGQPSAPRTLTASPKAPEQA